MGNANCSWGDKRKDCGPRNVDSLLQRRETGFFFFFCFLCRTQKEPCHHLGCSPTDPVLDWIPPEMSDKIRVILSQQLFQDLLRQGMKGK